MTEHDVVVYVSDNNKQCLKVIELIEAYNVPYKVKNVSRERGYMKELQNKGIFGTPATFIKGEKRAILGYQKEKIRSALYSV
ncbi:glutaredoxin family protein [Oceanobacillus luteolus]|uniref:Glutaredoxin domain-containing protein n=1 Tax=Oceanobacillus luteolus TaxID=1274358 RepID=A0ABW4HVC2_9BACI|nr:glutaredoxin domain-containing protein [Oceanobacillus luteolus]MCM3742203.1 glutaredoxin family protein [Oceanobacillus luteolus]